MFVTNYKGVLDDTFLGELFSNGTPYVNNGPGIQYISGAYTEPPPPNLTPGQHDCHNNLRCRGIFFRQSFQRPVKIASVTDGTSHTFMIGENLPDYDNHSTAYYGNGDWCSCNIPLNNLLTVDPESPRSNLQYWAEQQGFRSRHPGGAQFCLVDGSVRFVAESMDNQTTAWPARETATSRCPWIRERSENFRDAGKRFVWSRCTRAVGYLPFVSCCLPRMVAARNPRPFPAR